MTQLTATKLATQPSSGLSAQEVAYQLSTAEAEIIAVSYAPGIGSAPDMFGLMITGRYIDSTGAPQETHDGLPLTANKTVSCKKLDLGSGVTSIQALRDEALDALINDADGIYAEILVTRALTTPV